MVLSQCACPFDVLCFGLKGPVTPVKAELMHAAVSTMVGLQLVNSSLDLDFMVAAWWSVRSKAHIGVLLQTESTVSLLCSGSTQANQLVAAVLPKHS